MGKSVTGRLSGPPAGVRRQQPSEHGRSPTPACSPGTSAPFSVRAREFQQLLRRNVKRFRGGLVFKAHRPLYHSTLGSKVKKKKRRWDFSSANDCVCLCQNTKVDVLTQLHGQFWKRCT